MAERYRIELEGELNREWASSFGDVELVHTADGGTILTGTLVDQAALHGLLIRIRDLGIPILLIARLNRTESNLDNQKEIKS